MYKIPNKARKCAAIIKYLPPYPLLLSHFLHTLYFRYGVDAGGCSSVVLPS